MFLPVTKQILTRRGGVPLLPVASTITPKSGQELPDSFFKSFNSSLFLPNNSHTVTTLFARLTHQRNFPCPDGQGHQANAPDRSQKVPRHVPQRVKDRCVILLPETVQKYGDASERANQ